MCMCLTFAILHFSSIRQVHDRLDSHSCRSSALLCQSLYRSFSLPYLWNHLTDLKKIFIKILSKMYLSLLATLPYCRSSALLFKSPYCSFSLSYLLNRLNDFYHFFIKIISKWICPLATLSSCRSSALFFKSPYRSFSLLYLLNRLTDFFNFFAKMICKMTSIRWLARFTFNTLVDKKYTLKYFNCYTGSVLEFIILWIFVYRWSHWQLDITRCSKWFDTGILFKP